jgi:carboxypeptidase family protein
MRRLVVLCATAVLFVSCGDRPPTRPSGGIPTVAPNPSIPRIHGFVTDAFGQPLTGARVEWAGVAEAWGDRGHGVPTDTQGAYTFGINGLESIPGAPTVNLRATKAGYAEQEMQVRFVDGLEVDFRLSPSQ